MTGTVTSESISRYERGSFLELLAIALPMMVGHGLESIMMMMDRVFLTWYDADAMAGSLPAGILFWTIISLFHGTASFMNTFVAQYEGAGQYRRVSAAVWQGLYFTAVAGAAVMLLAPFSTAIFAFGQHAPEVQVQEARYFGVLALGAIPQLMAPVLASFFSGRGQTQVLLAVSASSVLIDGVLNYCFVFGPGPFPEWGIAGAAFTTVIGACWACCCYLFLLTRPGLARYGFFGQWPVDFKLFTRFIRYGVPNAVFLFVDVGGWTVFMFSLGWLGTNELAASTLAFNLNTAAFIPVIGLGIGVTTLVGNRVGEGRPDLAARSTWLGFAVAEAFILLCAIAYVFFPEVLLMPYAWGAKPEEFETVRPIIIRLLQFVAIYSIFDAMAIIFSSAIRGAGDTFFSMVLTICTVLGLLIFPTAAMWWAFDAGYIQPTLGKAWTYCSIYIAVMGFAFLARFLQGKWRIMSVIEPTLIDDMNSKESATGEPFNSGSITATASCEPHVDCPLVSTHAVPTHVQDGGSEAAGKM
jgi:multidrug resistance protein, MATE family